MDNNKSVESVEQKGIVSGLAFVMFLIFAFIGVASIFLG